MNGKEVKKESRERERRAELTKKREEEKREKKGTKRREMSVFCRLQVCNCFTHAIIQVD